MKKSIILLVIFVITALQLSAMAGQEPEMAAEEKMTISWFGPFAGDLQEGNAVQAHLEEKFNVKIQNIPIARKEREKLTLQLTSGEGPDCGYQFITPVDFYMKGVYRSIPKDMIVKHVPSQAKWLDSLGPMAWQYGLAPGKTDEYMGLVRSYDYAVGVEYQPVFRLDWLEKIGMAPTGLIDCGAGKSEGKSYWTKTAPTFDQFEQTLYAFRDGDFDGNGKPDTIPYAIQGDLGSRGLAVMLAMFGLNGVDNYNDRGKTVKLAVHPNLKDALKTFQKWYRDKILDSELPTVSREQRNDKVIAGLAGAYSSAPVYIASGSNPASDGWMPHPLYRKDPRAKAVMTNQPIGKDGTHVGYAKSAGALPIDAKNIMFMVKRGTPDEKLAKILQMVEYMNYDKTGRIYVHFGWPGEHFNWAGEPWASYAVPTDKFHRGGSTGILTYSYMHWYRDLHVTHYINPEHQPLMKFFYADGEGARIAVPAYREDVFKESKYSDLWAQYGGALNTIRDEFVWEAITKNMDIDSRWDAYVKTWLGAGGKQIHDELEKMPIVSELRKGNKVY